MPRRREIPKRDIAPDPLYDSALVSAADGSGKNVYTRDRRQFRRMLIDTVRLHRTLQRDWATLSRQYRSALPMLTSADAWADHLGTKQ